MFIFSREEETGLEKGRELLRATQPTQRETCLSANGPALPCLPEWMNLLLNVSCGFVLFPSLEGLGRVLRIIYILKGSTAITAGSQYVFIEEISNSFHCCLQP